MKNIWFKLISFLILFPNFVFAQTATSTGLKSAFPMAAEVAKNNYDTTQNLNTILSNVISVILSLVGVIFIVFIVYAGYLWMTASGNEQKSDKAKEIIRQSIIGLIVVIGAYAISFFLIKIFGSQLTL